jgi:hypothetical protein
MTQPRDARGRFVKAASQEILELRDLIRESGELYDTVNKRLLKRQLDQAAPQQTYQPADPFREYRAAQANATASAKAPQYPSDDFTDADQGAFVEWVQSGGGNATGHADCVIPTGGGGHAADHPMTMETYMRMYSPISQPDPSLVQWQPKPRRRWWWPFGRKR